MSNQNIILFEDRKVRSYWDAQKETWYFSIVDIVGILSDQPTVDKARNYWKVLENRLLKEGNETVTNCNQLKLQAEDGKMRLTDVGNVVEILRLIQSIPYLPKFSKQKGLKAAKRFTVEVSDTTMSLHFANAGHPKYLSSKL